jgi:ketohexokinase
MYSTIGAGDTFIAGILYGLIYRGKDWDFERRLKFANYLAGLKVTQEGFSYLHRALDSQLYWVATFLASIGVERSASVV